MKKKFGQNIVKGRKKADVFLKNAIFQSNKTKENSKKGAQVFTVTHNDAGPDTIYYKHSYVPPDVTKPAAQKKKLPDETTIMISVARHLNNQFNKALGKNVTLAAKLKRVLKINKTADEKPFVDPTYKPSAVFENLAAKNINLREGKTGEKEDATENLEYVPGTVIYYGAKVALQARHGGYLSYHNAVEIKASAHKILNQTKFIIINSSDLTDFGAVKYGDAIWLQAGQHEVLGANYVSSSTNANGVETGERKIKPALINCRRNNIFKAQQYGRWIVLNRDMPTETIGQFVLHHDKIILEQEWYFLASSSPYEASMHRHGSNASFVVGQNINLFKPTEDCMWRMHLLGLPGDEKGNEKQRQMLLHHAQDQLEVSNENRFKKKDGITKSLRDSLPMHLTDEAYVKENLHHKRTEDAMCKHYIKK
jgi:hypothetical protein